MSNRHRKNGHTPKPTLQEFVGKRIREIEAAFTVPMRVTVIVRRPGVADGEAVFSDDDIPSLIETLQRRSQAIKESQAAA